MPVYKTCQNFHTFYSKKSKIDFLKKLTKGEQVHKTIKLQNHNLKNEDDIYYLHDVQHNENYHSHGITENVAMELELRL